VFSLNVKSKQNSDVLGIALAIFMKVLFEATPDVYYYGSKGQQRNEELKKMIIT